MLITAPYDIRVIEKHIVVLKDVVNKINYMQRPSEAHSTLGMAMINLMSRKIIFSNKS